MHGNPTQQSHYGQSLEGFFRLQYLNGTLIVPDHTGLRKPHTTRLWQECGLRRLSAISTITSIYISSRGQISDLF